MAAIAEPKLGVRSMIPVFQLKSTDGKTVSIWDYKGRKHVVLAFLPPECPVCMAFLRSVSDAYQRYEEENAVVLPIIIGSQEQAVSVHDELQPPYPILYDEHGKVGDRYTDRLSAIFVADKFGELYAKWNAGRGESFPSQKDILDVLEAIELECPE